MGQVEQIKRPKFALVTEQAVDSPYWAVTRYYQDKNLEQIKAFIIEAARAFWLPFAQVHQGEKTQSVLKDAVLKSLSLLRWRVTELTISYGLDLFKQETINPLVKQGEQPASLEIEQRLFVQTNSPSYILWRYLLEDEIGLNLEKKILWSSSAYWGVLAYQEVLNLCQNDLRVVAANCVAQLQGHIQLFYQYFPEILMENPNPLIPEKNPTTEEKTVVEFNQGTKRTKKLDLEAEQEKLLNCSELDDVGLQMFGTDQF